MSDDRRTPERSSLVGGAEPVLVARYTDPICKATGHVVIDTLATGVSFGGVRAGANLKWTDLAQLARSSTIRYHLARVPLGGARLGLQYDPEAPEFEDLLGRFLTSVRPLLAYSVSIGPDLNVPTPLLDRVIERYQLPWKMEAVQRSQGWPIEHWHNYQSLLEQTSHGIPLRELQVPYSVTQAVLSMGEFLFHHEQTVGVVGVGPFGLQIARLLVERGALVVAISGASAGIYSANGVRADLIQSGSQLPMSIESGIYITADELYSMPIDVLVLASGANSITIDNVGKIRASLVVEAAARAVSYEAEKVLVAGGTPVLPSFATTLGAVLIAQTVLAGGNIQLEDAVRELCEQVNTTTRELARLAATLRISLREAGTRLAFHRVSGAQGRSAEEDEDTTVHGAGDLEETPEAL